MKLPWLEQDDFTSVEAFRQHCRIHLPETFNFAFDVVDKIAAEDPVRIAMQWCNDEGEERTFTMADIRDWSNRAANAFWRLGVRRGDKVMLILKRRSEYWFALMGLSKIGAVAIPATNLLKAHDITYRVQAGSIKMLLVVNETSIREAVEEAATQVEIPLRALVRHNGAEGWLDFNALMDAEPATLDESRCARGTTAKDMMLLYFTSGTSGMPKMVAHNMMYPLGHIITAKFWQCCKPGGLHLTVAETGWGKAAWGKIYGQWMCGSAIMVYDMDRFHPKDLLHVIEKYKVTTFCAPPTVYRFLIQEDLSQYDWSNITHCTTAGEALNPEVFQRFQKATGHRIYEAFGQTETTALTLNPPWIPPRPGSMGIASPEYDLVVMDADDHPCEAGAEGQLCIRTDKHVPAGLFMEYYRASELTERQWRAGVYHTGDVVWRDEDGYFWFVGRADDVIKSSGYRIGPFEVESALMEHPAVTECAITGVPDPVRGQVVKATIVLSRGYEPSEALVKELQNHVKRVTAPYKYPRVIEFVKELPKTISGKIRHVAIREKDASPQTEGAN